MAQTFSQSLFHVVFSTKGRQPFLKETWQEELFAYIGGIVRGIGGKALLINGVPGHVHFLVSLRATVALADALRAAKARSSAWIRRRDRTFAWHSGYAAFSVSQSKVENVRRYIAGQQEHHRRVRFEDEFVELLKRHQLEYDERYPWG